MDMYISMNNDIVYQLMGVFCDRPKLGSTAALDCLTDSTTD